MRTIAPRARAVASASANPLKRKNPRLFQKTGVFAGHPVALQQVAHFRGHALGGDAEMRV